jgi:hypothetical protein
MDIKQIENVWNFHDAESGGNGIPPNKIVEALTEAGAKHIDRYAFHN